MTCWAPISEIPEYAISGDGQVMRLVNRCSGREGNILRTALSKKGYPVVALCKAGKVVHRPIHRLVALTFLPNPENKPEVNHCDGVKTHSVFENLEWSTSSENKKHAFRLGLMRPTYGENHPQAKLTDVQVGEMRELRRTKRIKLKQLASQFGISWHHAKRICLGLERAR